MSGSLNAFTRRLEECRRRWNRHSLEYVLESGRILHAARDLSRNQGRWLRWLRSEAHINQSTAFRHMRVADFLKRDYALKHTFATLSLAKVYSLTRTKPVVARRLAHDDRVRAMTDAEFAQFFQHYLPTSNRTPTATNLFRSIMSGLEKADRGIARWKRARRAIPTEYRGGIQSRLRELLAAASHLRGSGRKAL